MISEGKLQIHLYPEELSEGRENMTKILVGKDTRQGSIKGSDEDIYIFAWRENRRVCVFNGFKVVREIPFKDKDQMVKSTFDVKDLVVRLLINSSGLACEHQGSCLGLYEYAGEHQGRPSYRQMHTVTGDCKCYLYYIETDKWCSW